MPSVYCRRRIRNVLVAVTVTDVVIRVWPMGVDSGRGSGSPGPQYFAKGGPSITGPRIIYLQEKNDKKLRVQWISFQGEHVWTF